ncbi:hypothetical protein C8J56DRAFT_805232, partial [Mycena floridula]
MLTVNLNLHPDLNYLHREVVLVRRLDIVICKMKIDLLRHGACIEEDVQMVAELVLDVKPTDFAMGPWSETVLLTSRQVHVAQNQWNKAAIIRHHDTTKNWIYVSPAEDIGKNQLTMAQRLRIAGMPHIGIAKLRDEEEMSIGMKVMILFNEVTAADLVNGTKGVIDDIVLDTREGDV